MRDNGVRRAAVFRHVGVGRLTPAARSNVEDIARARAAAGNGAPELVKLRQYYDHPVFVEMFTESVGAAAQTVPPGARLVFTAHSIPFAAQTVAGQTCTAVR